MAHLHHVRRVLNNTLDGSQQHVGWVNSTLDGVNSTLDGVNSNWEGAHWHMGWVDDVLNERGVVIRQVSHVVLLVNPCEWTNKRLSSKRALND